MLIFGLEVLIFVFSGEVHLLCAFFRFDLIRLMSPQIRMVVTVCVATSAKFLRFDHAGAGRE